MCYYLCARERGRTGTKTISLTRDLSFYGIFPLMAVGHFYLCKHPPIHLSFPAPPSLRDPSLFVNIWYYNVPSTQLGTELDRDIDTVPALTGWTVQWEGHSG